MKSCESPIVAGLADEVTPRVKSPLPTSRRSNFRVRTSAGATAVKEGGVDGGQIEIGPVQWFGSDKNPSKSK